MVLLCLLVSAPICAMNAQLFFPIISLSEKIPFSFKEVFQKYREKQISLNWLIQVKTKSQHCSLNHVKGDKGKLL